MRSILSLCILSIFLALSGPPEALAETTADDFIAVVDGSECLQAVPSYADIAAEATFIRSLKPDRPAHPLGQLIGVLGAVAVGVVLPTVTVRPKGKKARMNINKSDYDANPDQYELVDEDSGGGAGGEGEPPEVSGGGEGDEGGGAPGGGAPEFASSAAEKLAAENSIEASEITPTGAGGKITKPDVEAAIAAIKEEE